MRRLKYNTTINIHTLIFKDSVTILKSTFIVRDKNLNTSKHRSVRILPVLFDHQPLCLKNIEDNDKSSNKTNLCQFNRHTKFPSKTLFNTLCTNQIVASTSPRPLPTYPRHLTPFPAREGGLIISVFPGEGHLITFHKGWGI